MAEMRKLLDGPDPVIAPGCYDALSALLIERAGFPAAYFSGASLAYTRFGRPDIGLVSMKEVADSVSAIRERLDLPLIVDCDTGFGNALNVQRTVRLMERSGASAIQLEDQLMPKRCGHLADKRVIPGGEMVGKIKAALDARASDETLVIARTDAIAVEGFEAALERAESYHQAGADVIFVEAPRSAAELAGIAERFRARSPLMANMVEGGSTPITDWRDLGGLGFSLVIYPGGAVRTLVHALQAFFANLKEQGSTAAFRDRMLDFAALNAVLGTQDMLERGRSYEFGDS